jgi:hypothetical protein
MEPGDLNFVLDGWIRSWRTSPWAGCIPNNLIWETTRSCIAGLLVRGARVDVAAVTRTDGSERLVGFICWEPGVLHYVFVKRTGFRGLGIGRHLVRTFFDRPGIITHRTPMSGWLLDDGWAWDPIPARVKDYDGVEDAQRT